MCCIGCRAAAAAIVDFGLGEYYRVREVPASRPVDADRAAAVYAVYDDSLLLDRYIEAVDDGFRSSLIVGGMTCAACAWLLEQRLARTPGVQEFAINFATRRAEVRWDAARTGLATICRTIGEIGFEARPYTVDAGRAAEAAEARGLLARFGVAAIFGMQVMMIAIAFYVDDADAFEASQWHFLRWVSLVLTLPVVVYSATPFFRAARTALRARELTMDVPVSLAIVAAFAGSVWHTVLGTGEIWFDSVVMFVAFLLASRWLELRARVMAATRLESLASLMPDAACRIVHSDGVERHEQVPALRLTENDEIWVRAGEVIAADGMVVAGTSSVDESILTGEALPQLCAPGARVLAGSVNLEAPLRIKVSAVGRRSFAGHLAELVQHAAQARPAHDEVGARVARVFVAAILAVAGVTAMGWSLYEPSRAWETTLAVLVVSCPCALAIARPAAVAAAHAALLASGVAVLAQGALERLARVGEVLFDKTGTLTHGRLALARVESFGAAGVESVIALARLLAEGSEHPLARALRALPGPAPVARIEDSAARAGGGIRALVDGRPTLFGSRRYLADCAGRDLCAGLAVDDSGGKEAWLAVDDVVVGRLEFNDVLRDEAAEVVAALRANGLRCAILSGDRASAVDPVAVACGLDDAHAQQTPTDKLAYVAARQTAGATIAMIGDGINDSAVMAGADVSIAVADASAPARQQADILLLTPSLGGVTAAFTVARQLVRIIRQNLAWAIAYNVIAVPLAVSGLLAPWSAALGMSLSSLIVVANALRIRPPAP